MDSAKVSGVRLGSRVCGLGFVGAYGLELGIEGFGFRVCAGLWV